VNVKFINTPNTLTTSSKINNSSVFSPTTSTSPVKEWSRLRDSLRAQDIEFTRQGVEQPTISNLVLATSTQHAPGSTTRHASTSTRHTSRSTTPPSFSTTTSTSHEHVKGWRISEILVAKMNPHGPTQLNRVTNPPTAPSAIPRNLFLRNLSVHSATLRSCYKSGARGA